MMAVGGPGRRRWEEGGGEGAAWDLTHARSCFHGCSVPLAASIANSAALLLLIGLPWPRNELPQHHAPGARTNTRVLPSNNFSLRESLSQNSGATSFFHCLPYLSVAPSPVTRRPSAQRIEIHRNAHPGEHRVSFSQLERDERVDGLPFAAPNICSTASRS